MKRLRHFDAWVKCAVASAQDVALDRDLRQLRTRRAISIGPALRGLLPKPVSLPCRWALTCA
jgi:hypothetical protein